MNNPIHKLLDTAVNLKYVAYISKIFDAGIGGHDYKSFNILLENDKIQIFNFYYSESEHMSKPIVSDEEFIKTHENLIKSWHEYHEKH